MNTNYLLLGSLALYFVLALAFTWEMNLGKALYFLGAFILIIGVYVLPLYDRIEVLEKTVLLLLERLNLDIVQHDDVYIELKEK
jgi:uncharacterized membrane protein